MKKIVWLASWYPNDADPFTGDFIRRHALATSVFQPIDVVYIGKTSRPRMTPLSGATGLTEHTLYYSKEEKKRKNERFHSAFLYWKTFAKWFTGYRLRNGKPDLVHVHVAWRAGLLALFLKKRYRIPYVLTEHWTAYYPDSTLPLSGQSRLLRYLLKKILQNASLVLPVSEDLGRQMTVLAGQLPLRVVANVVDTTHFRPGTERSGRFRFIHVSSMTAIKKPAAIVRAFQELKKSGVAAELVMVGPFPATAKEYTGDPSIRFTGEIPYEAVAAEMRAAHAFVLFSDRENQPCVILEALCCGLPVIATRTGGIPEVIGDTNGLLVSPGDDAALTRAMGEMIAKYSRFDQVMISSVATERYRYAEAGRKHHAVYQEFCKK